WNGSEPAAFSRHEPNEADGRKIVQRHPAQRTLSWSAGAREPRDARARGGLGALSDLPCAALRRPRRARSALRRDRARPGVASRAPPRRVDAAGWRRPAHRRVRLTQVRLLLVLVLHLGR